MSVCRSGERDSRHYVYVHHEGYIVFNGARVSIREMLLYHYAYPSEFPKTFVLDLIRNVSGSNWDVLEQ